MEHLALALAQLPSLPTPDPWLQYGALGALVLVICMWTLDRQMERAQTRNDLRGLSADIKALDSRLDGLIASLLEVERDRTAGGRGRRKG